MKPRTTKAPKKATNTPAKPATVKATAAKPKLVARPKPRATAKPVSNTIETPIIGQPVVGATPAPATGSTNGPLHQIPPESPAPPPAELVEPVIQRKPLIITIPPDSPAASTETGILTSSGDKKASGYAVVESEVTPPPAPSVPAVVESNSTTTPSVPTVTIPPSHSLEDVSSIQIGDVLIIAVWVQPAPAPEAEP